VRVLAIFGPTGVGKTAVAIAIAERLREGGEAPVAISCDAIQVYRGLEILSGAATAEEQARLEHRLLSFVEVDGEFSAGQFAQMARDEIDGLLAEGRRPIVVGGTGLYLRAALSDLDLRPPVEAAIRNQVQREIAEHGPEALHAELEPDLAGTVHPADRKRIARLTELSRAGIEPHAGAERLWSESLRRPTLLAGLVIDREELADRIDRRVDAMVAEGAGEEVERAAIAGASRTARAAIGFEELLAGEVDAMKAAQRRYARRQLTWMRRMEDVETIDVSGLGPGDVADEILAILGADE
jgi:tRNA dimethylallyltransferase